LYSNLRFVISASVVGCAGLIGVLALLPATLEDRLLASAELSAPAARPCKQQNWLNLDRNCLTRRGMPWVAARPAPDAAQAPSSAETSADQALTETPSSAAAAEATVQPGEVTGSRQETATAPIAGHSLIVIYQTSFEHGDGMETFTLIERNGQWYLAKYYVTSTALK